MHKMAILNRRNFRFPRILRRALFCDFMHSRVLILLPTFRDIYQSHLYVSKEVLDRYLVPKRRHEIAIIRCVIT